MFWLAIAMDNATLCNEAWERMDDNDVRARQLMDVFIAEHGDDRNQNEHRTSRQDRVIGDRPNILNLFAEYVLGLAQEDGAKIYVEFLR